MSPEDALAFEEMYGISVEGAANNIIRELFMKEKFKESYMQVAEIFAEHSYCVRKKVGAIAVKDNRIISIGYNGTPSGWENCCEFTQTKTYRSEDHLEKLKKEGWTVVCNKDYLVSKLVTKKEVLHAESNLIAKLVQSGESAKGCAVFITASPCIDCAKQLYQAGVAEVYYKELYRSDEGIEFLEQCKIKVEQI